MPFGLRPAVSGRSRRADHKFIRSYCPPRRRELCAFFRLLRLNYLKNGVPSEFFCLLVRKKMSRTVFVAFAILYIPRLLF